MADKTTIVNRALSLIGSEPINNLTDDTPEAQIANRMYEESRRSILSECLWNFAAKRVNLVALAETLPWSLDSVKNVFQLPADIIRIFGTSSRSAVWRKEQDRLITDVTSIGIIYVFNLEDTTKFSSSFVDAFSDKLAADMSFTTLNSGTNAQKMVEKYDGVSLPKAMAENSQEGTPPQVKDDLWSYARFGFSPVGRSGIIVGS